MDISSDVESAASAAADQYSDFMSDMRNFALLYLGGNVQQPGSSDFPDPPPDTAGTFQLKQDQMFKPDTILAAGWPVYAPPVAPEWDTLWAEAEIHARRVWQSSELDALSLKLVELVQGGNAAWFTDAYQSRMFNQDKDRRLQALDDSLRLIASRHAARGNRMPNSALLAQENELVQKYQFDNTSRSGELLKMVEEAARNFMQFGMQQGLSYEQLNMGFTTSYNQAILEPIKLKYESYMAEINAAAQSYEAEIRGVVARFEAEKASWELTSVYNNMVAEKDLYPWKKYQIQVQAIATEYAQKVAIYKTQVDAEISAIRETLVSIVNVLAIGSQSEIKLVTGKIVT